jgi:hypothetical protein
MSDALEALTQRLRELGAPDPEEWASSELREDIPQTAAFVALRNLWPDLIHPWRDADVLARVPASRALLDAGVAPEAVSKAMCPRGLPGRDRNALGTHRRRRGTRGCTLGDVDGEGP